MKMLVFTLLLALSSHLYADILYINLNDSKAHQTSGIQNHEITGIRSAAQARGEKVDIIPRPGVKLNSKTLEDYIKHYSNSSKSFSSVVISGHDGNGYFGGSQGNVTAMNFDKILKNPEYSSFTNKVKGLYLWGCYTNIPAATDHWRAYFPNLKVLGGFSGQSPLNPDKSNTDTLSHLLKEEASIIRDTTSDEQVKKLLNRINNPSSAGSLTLSLSRVCEDLWTEEDQSKYFRISNKTYQAIDLDSIMKVCRDPKTDAKLKHIFKVFKCFRKAYNKFCMNIPKNKHNSILRTAYNDYQSLIHCVEYNWDKYPDAETPESVIRLIYYNDIQKNFRKKFSSKISRAVQITRGQDRNNDGVDDSKFLTDPNISRYDWIKGIRNLYRHLIPGVPLRQKGESGAQIKQRLEQESKKLSHEERKKYEDIKSLINLSDQYLYWTDPECIPISDFSPACH